MSTIVRGSATDVDRRFVAAVGVLPAALVLVAGPVLSATSRLSGHTVTHGAVTINSAAAVVMGIGFVATAVLIVIAIRHRLHLERARYAPLPLTVAFAVFVATAFVGPLPGATSAPVTASALLVGLAIGALVGHRVATSLLMLKILPTTAAPAPPDAQRYPITQRATAVWTGRLPALRYTTWLLPFAIIGVEWWLARRGIPMIMAIVLTPLVCVAHILGRANRRLRVTIGPSGIQLRSGLFNRLRQSVGLEVIAAASTTSVEHVQALTTDWHGTTRRLTIATHNGPALQVSLTDGTELVISMMNPAEPAGVINSLLDRRATVGVAGDGPSQPSC